MATLNDKLELIQQARDNIQTALAEKGQVVGKDIRDYAEAVTNIEGGSGDIKLFDTVEHMQQDPNAQEGDLAVVYREEIQPIDENSEFDSCTFPNEVILNEAFTSSISGSFRSTGSSYFDGMVSMSSSRFRFNGYGESDDVRIQYTSSDGITYTRTDGGEELQEFGTSIKYEPEEPWNDVIGNFMKIGGNHFEGLYEYKAFKNKNKIHIYSYSELAWDNSSRKLTGTGGEVIEFDIEATLNKITEYTETNFSDYRSGTYHNNPIYEYMLYYDNNCIVFPFTTQNEGTPYKFINNLSLLIDNTTWKATGGIIMTNPSVTYNLHEIRVNITTGQLSYALLQENFTNEEYQPLTRFNNYKFVGNINKDGIFNYEYQNGLTTILYYSTEDSTWYESNCIYEEKPGIDDIKYLFVDTQLNATADDVYEKTFYGKNGVENGTLTTNISSTFDDKNAEIYATMQDYYNSLTPRVLTDNDKTIDKSIWVIPCKTDGTSLIDTSNVTDMSSMFENCNSLTTIPQLNTSNVTNMYSMFKGCTSLTTISQLNTGNVTDTSQMFASCTSLTTIPLLDTSNVTYIEGMFGNCNSLTAIPLLDISNVTNISFMFEWCTSLTTIPQLNTSNVTDMSSMFAHCTSLTTIPLLDTSNVTNMNYIFYYCTSLTTIPQLNTSNVTNMYNMFCCCTSLTTIPLLDTSNVTNMSGMFANCTSLTTIPQLNTSNVTDTSQMFASCTSLTTIPLLDTSNVTYMYNMFKGCTSLTNTSLNNILQMCKNAIKMTSNKTLRNIGLSQEQATICQGLSNYSAFTSAGWTTGY